MISMKDFESLVSIWNEQKTSPSVDYREVIDRYKKTRNKFRTKLWAELIWMTIATLLLGYIWLSMPFTLWTTHISMFIFEICCIFYIYTQIKNLRTISDNSLLETPEKHIEYLERFKLSRYMQNTRNYYFYTVAMGIALGLYFIEFFTHVNTFVLIFAVGFSIAWFAFCTLWIRKVYIKKEEKRFNEMLNELKRLKNQFTNS